MPARDVLVITGSESAAGLAKARRCVERVYFAGAHHLLVQDLLERRGYALGALRRGTARCGRRQLGGRDRDREDEYWSPPEDRTIVPRPGRSRYG